MSGKVAGPCIPYSNIPSKKKMRLLAAMAAIVLVVAGQNAPPTIGADDERVTVEATDLVRKWPPLCFFFLHCHPLLGRGETKVC